MSKLRTMVGAALAGVMLTSAALVVSARAQAPDPRVGAETDDPSAVEPLQSSSALIYMSDDEEGAMRRSFPASTSELWAVVEYSDAEGDRYVVELEDLAGNIVRRGLLPPVSGSGRRAVNITVANFVDSYAASIVEVIGDGAAPPEDSLPAAVAALQVACDTRPEVPDPWPPVVPTPSPGEPTATPAPPDEYTEWLTDVLADIDSSGLMSSELERKLRALTALPDVEVGEAGEAVAMAVDSAAERLVDLPARLGEARAQLKPSDSGVRPSPERGCAIIADVKSKADAAVASARTGLEALPEDVSGWRLPTTAARYRGSFVECQQYLASLYVVAVEERKVDTESFTLSDPGEPALIFRSADETDSSSLGTLRLAPAGGADRIFAKGVRLPGVNHEATVSGYITDANCNPLSGVPIRLELVPEDGGTISATDIASVQGEFQVDYEAPEDLPIGPDDERIDIEVRAQAADDEDVTALTRFNIVGPADEFRIIVNPREINRLKRVSPRSSRPGVPTPTPAPSDPYSLGRQRGGITVEVKDAYGRSVADGTQLILRIREGHPGLLAYERRVRGSSGVELVELGKSAELITRGGNSVVPPDSDPGVINMEALYLIPGPDGDGFVTLEVEADGKTANSNDPTTGEPTILIFSRTSVLLPLGLRNGIPTPALPRPVRPTRTPSPLLEGLSR